MADAGLPAGSVQGTGRDGRVLKQDVLAALAAGFDASNVRSGWEGSRETRREKMSMLRRKVAERLVSVKNETAMLTTFNEVDMKPVMDLRKKHKDAFKEQFGKATILGYDSLGWGDAEAVHVAEVLASGAAPRLKKLFLGHNKIGDKGCKALAAALGKEGAAPRLEELYIYTDRYRSDTSGIGVEGYEALRLSSWYPAKVGTCLSSKP